MEGLFSTLREINALVNVSQRQRAFRAGQGEGLFQRIKPRYFPTTFRITVIHRYQRLILRHNQVNL